MTTHDDDYLDGNAAAGALSEIFAVDITSAEGQCAHCGTTKRFAEAHVFTRCPGMVARCAVCQNVLVRVVRTGGRMFLDMRGIARLCINM